MKRAVLCCIFPVLAIVAACSLPALAQQLPEPVVLESKIHPVAVGEVAEETIDSKLAKLVSLKLQKAALEKEEKATVESLRKMIKQERHKLQELRKKLKDQEASLKELARKGRAPILPAPRTTQNGRGTLPLPVTAPEPNWAAPRTAP
jgi:hypothetical protein